MSSYRDGLPTGLTRARLVGDAHIGSRSAVARFAHRHVNTVARYCIPIACDVGTRADLYDLDSAVRQLTAMATFLCCIEDDGGNRCGSPVMTNAPEAICEHHAAVIGEFWKKRGLAAAVRDRLTQQEATGDPLGDQRVRAEAMADARRTEVVYYLQVGPLVKIGYTADIQRRMQDYPPTSRLLVVEPGGSGLEWKRHREFNEYLEHGSEWFVAGPRLREHIEALMATNATPRTSRSA